MTNSIVSYSRENGGRVLLLFLLFLLALYQLLTAGLTTFGIICLIPLVIPFIYFAFSWPNIIFWILLFINYFIQFFGKQQWLPHGIPTSLYNELLELLLIAIAIVDVRKDTHFNRLGNLMFLCVSIWCAFCTLELLNDTCDLGISVAGWYTGARMMAFQILYAVIIFTVHIENSKKLTTFFRFWAALSIFSVLWTLKQQYVGLSEAENLWMQTRGRTTHLLQGGTLIRYWSTFNDAAQYGIHAACVAIIFFTMSITTKIKIDRYFFLLTGIVVTWQMFASGTRTATFCLIAGFATFLVLSKSFRVMVPSAIVGGILISLLVFTDIGQGNQQIRRMRSAFNKHDASASVRDINQAAIKKYLADAPWGIGLSVSYDNVPANNKFKKLSVIPPDSEYVFIWVHTGVIGITVFLILTVIMFLGACWVVLTKLKNRSLIGIGGGLCSAFVSIQLGGYANQVLMQFPNCLMFYGGLTIVYILPYIEPEWAEMENKRYLAQVERERLKLEKKLAKRV